MYILINKRIYLFRLVSFTYQNTSSSLKQTLPDHSCFKFSLQHLPIWKVIGNISKMQSLCSSLIKYTNLLWCGRYRTLHSKLTIWKRSGFLIDLMLTTLQTERIAYFINENYRWLSGFSHHEESPDKFLSLTNLFKYKENL